MFLRVILPKCTFVSYWDLCYTIKENFSQHTR